MATGKGTEDSRCRAVFESGYCCSHKETWAQQAFADRIMCGLAQGILGIIFHLYFLLSVSNKSQPARMSHFIWGRDF